jgi:hypothetical protein
VELLKKALYNGEHDECTLRFMKESMSVLHHIAYVIPISLCSV